MIRYNAKINVILRKPKAAIDIECAFEAKQPVELKKKWQTLDALVLQSLQQHKIAAERFVDYTAVVEEVVAGESHENAI